MGLERRSECLTPSWVSELARGPLKPFGLNGLNWRTSCFLKLGDLNAWTIGPLRDKGFQKFHSVTWDALWLQWNDDRPEVRK